MQPEIEVCRWFIVLHFLAHLTFCFYQRSDNKSRKLNRSCNFHFNMSPETSSLKPFCKYLMSISMSKRKKKPSNFLCCLKDLPRIYRSFFLVRKPISKIILFQSQRKENIISPYNSYVAMFCFYAALQNGSGMQ